MSATFAGPNAVHAKSFGGRAHCCCSIASGWAFGVHAAQLAVVWFGIFCHADSQRDLVSHRSSFHE